MDEYNFGEVKIRFFRGNDNVFVMYEGHKLFIRSKDIKDFIRALLKAKKYVVMGQK